MITFPSGVAASAVPSLLGQRSESLDEPNVEKFIYKYTLYTSASKVV